MSTCTLLPRRGVTIAAALMLGIGTLAACGGDGTAPPAQPSTTAGASPEDHKATMDDVLAGLARMKETGAAAASSAATGDFKTALVTYGQLHDAWEQVEGTVRDVDADAYEAIETALGLIKDGAENEVAARVSRGAQDQATAIGAFIKAKG